MMNVEREIIEWGNETADIESIAKICWLILGIEITKELKHIEKVKI